MQAVLFQGPVAGVKLPGRDQYVFVPGGAVVRVRIQAAAHDALDHQRLQPGLPHLLQDLQELVGLDRLQHHAADGLLLEGHKKPRVLFLGGRAVVYDLIDHGQHAVPVGHIKQRQPVLQGQLPVPGDLFIFQRRQKQFIFHVHFLPLRPFRCYYG